MFKKTIKIIVLVLAVGFILIQFYRPDLASPAVNASETLQASTQVPENVQTILNRSCNDCHTNETDFPWYFKIQPSASFLAGHIKEGRAALNFSTFNTYEKRRKRRKLDEMCEQVETAQMPLPSYTWIHRGSILSEEDKKIICDWTNQESSRLSAAQ